MQLRIQVSGIFCGNTTLKLESERGGGGQRDKQRHWNITIITVRIKKKKKQTRGRSQVAPHPEKLPSIPLFGLCGPIMMTKRVSWLLCHGAGFSRVCRDAEFFPPSFSQTQCDTSRRLQTEQAEERTAATRTLFSQSALLFHRSRLIFSWWNGWELGRWSKNDTRKTSELRSILEEEQRVGTFFFGGPVRETKASFRQREDAGVGEELAQSRLFFLFATALAGPACTARVLLLVLVCFVLMWSVLSVLHGDEPKKASEWSCHWESAERSASQTCWPKSVSFMSWLGDWARTTVQPEREHETVRFTHQT